MDRPRRQEVGRCPPAPSVGPVEGARSERRWRAFATAALALVVALPVLLALAPRDLWAPEEPRFGISAHEMAEDGDWLVPRLNGKPDAEKPPLLFWLVAAVERLVGTPTPWGARIPGALFAALATLMTFRLARRWFQDRDLALTAAVIFGTTGLVVWNGPRLAMDLALTALAAVALEGAIRAVAERSWAGVVQMGGAIGLGLLVKGPHVFYVPLAGAVGAMVALASGTPRPAAPGTDGRAPPPGTPGGNVLRLVVAVALGVAIFAAWLVPAVLLRGSETTYDGEPYAHRLIGQLSRRVVGESVPHQHGPLYLVPLLLAFGLPWTPLAVIGTWLAIRRRHAPAADRLGLSVALWALAVPLVLLSIASSKRETYLLPLLPSASVLAAYALHRARTSRLVATSMHGLVALMAVVAAAIAALPFVAPRVLGGDALDAVTGRHFATPAVVGACVVGALALAAVAVLAARFRSEPERVVRLTAVAAVGFSLGVFFIFLPIVNPAKSFADAASLARRVRPGATLAIAGTSDPSALWWDFGPDRLVTRVTDEQMLARVLAPDAVPALVIVKGRLWPDVGLHAPRGHLSVDERRVLDRARVLWARRVNGYVWHLLTNAPG